MRVGVLSRGKLPLGLVSQHPVVYCVILEWHSLLTILLITFIPISRLLRHWVAVDIQVSKVAKLSDHMEPSVLCSKVRAVPTHVTTTQAILART